MSRNLFEYDPLIGFRFIPGIRARVGHESGGYLVRCNEAGFRCDHEVATAKPVGTFRLILLGDSYSAGDGVSNGHRFGDLIEARFDRMQVLNFALPGSGTDQQYLAFREHARHLEYDLVLFCPMVENVRRNTATHRITANTADGRLVCRPKPYFRLSEGGLELHNTPVPKQVQPVPDEQPEAEALNGDSPLRNAARSLYRRFPAFHCFAQRVRRISDPHEYDDAKDPGWLLMKAILTACAADAAAPLLICPLPTFGHINRCLRADAYRQRFEELSTLANVKVIDILPDFWRLDPAQRKACRFEHDEHPTRLGHQVIADAIEPYVRAYYESDGSDRSV